MYMYTYMITEFDVYLDVYGNFDFLPGGLVNFVLTAAKIHVVRALKSNCTEVGANVQDLK